MKFTSLARWFGTSGRKTASRGKSRRRVSRPWRRFDLTRLRLEAMEDRTLLSVVLPNAIVTNQTPLTFAGPPSVVQYSAPSVAVDPINPNNVVSVFTLHNEAAPGTQKSFLSGQFSTNGGITWTPINTFPGNVLDPNSAITNRQPLPYSSDPTVAMDRSHNVYIVTSERKLDNTFGVLILQKYQFNQFTSPIVTTPLYYWGYQGSTNGLGADAALNPQVVVDNNLASYADPITGGVQSDQYAQGAPNHPNANVYVTFNTNYLNKQMPIPNFNPNTVKIIASSDGGLHFSAVRTLNSSNFLGAEHDSYPRLAVSQGTSNDRPAQFGRTTGGLVSAVWDDFNTMNPTPTQRNGGFINSTTISDGGINTFADGGNFPGGTTMWMDGSTGTFSGGNYNDALPAPPMMMGDVPAMNYFNASAVTFNPAFGNVTGINVTVDIEDNHLDAVELLLLSPTGTPYLLMNNHVDAMGMARMGLGVTGRNLGVDSTVPRMPGALTWDTVFDPTAPRPISDMSAVAPYASHFAPEGMLPTSLTAAQASGVWQLEVVDFRNSMDNPLIQTLWKWSISFTQHLTPNAQVRVTSTSNNALTGGIYAGVYPNKPVFYPSLGLGPSPVVASDNTLGSYSPHQGRLYVAYAGTGGVFLAISDNGGQSWTQRLDPTTMLPQPVNDDSILDGFSQGNRPKIQPEIAVDQTTGTLVYTYRDARYDASGRRFVVSLATSIDGGRTFQNAQTSQGQQVYLNAPVTAGDAITGQNVNVQPTPDNQSDGNGGNDTMFGWGDQMGLAVCAGHIYPIWSGNQNQGNLNIQTASVAIAAGPRVIGSSMGPIIRSTATLLDDGTSLIPLNSTYTADGIQQVDGFLISFDRPIADGRSNHGLSVTAADVQVIFHDTVTPQAILGTVIPVSAVVPVFDYDPTMIDMTGFVVSQFTQLAFQQYFGADTFLVRFAPQHATGTYSYSVGPVNGSVPGPRDQIRNALSPNLGNFMDQNANAVAGELPNGGTGGDSYSAPSPANNGPNFFAPYVRTTLPIIVPGPHILSTFVNGQPTTNDNLVLNAATGNIDIVFDRDMDPTTVTPQAISSFIGPAGNITGPFTLVPDANPGFQRSINGNITAGADPDPTHPRTYKLTFPNQNINGTYTFTLLPTVRAKNGDLLDTNLNAGVDVLRDVPSNGTHPVTYNNTGGTAILPGTSVTSTITINDSYLIQGITLSLNINYADVRDLSAYLQAPDGTRIQLFTNIGGTLPPFSNFTNTVLDDNASQPSGDPNPIQANRAPFNGSFNPQQPLSVLVGRQIAGTYQLVITNRSSSTSGQLLNWSMTFKQAVPRTGLGDPVADNASVSFRIFNLSKNNPISKQTWTPVGPAGIGDSAAGTLLQPNSHSGRIGGIAVDPSDPSGNTAYIAGASGGVWKTTNFLTSSASGPTYVPLTDSSPTFGLNIGDLVAFGRNNDTNQTILFAATGEGSVIGDTKAQGIGLLRSMDGGKSWTLLDSMDNTLPFSQRDHHFVGNFSFKVAVDPKLSPSAQVIVYVAMSGTNGGVYRSTDTGDTWTLSRAGQATDVTLAAGSADGVTGNLRIVYGAFRGEGVYMNDSQGGRWNLMAGGQGVLYLDARRSPATFVTVTAPSDNPNGAKGRITLAVPALVPSTDPNARIKNLLYEGWVYAFVSNTNDTQNGLYLTKDFGQNWTKVKIPHTAPPAGFQLPIFPTNDNTQPDFDVLASPNGSLAQGNYDISLVVDPNNPNVVYAGGTQDNRTSGLIRVDTTGLADARALFPHNNFLNDGGQNTNNTTGPLVLGGGQAGANAGLLDPVLLSLYTQPHWLNLLNDPFNPFLLNATLLVANFNMNGTVLSMNNSGAQVKSWIFYDDALNGSTDQHHVMALPDPLTGQTRLVFGDDQGVFSVVDPGDGTTNFTTGIGTQQFAPFSSRNGNLQITQFYGAASQPSQLAANIAGALVYGEAQDDGFPTSDPNVLQNGNIQWTGVTGDGQWVGTDQTGSGNVFDYRWPCCQGGEDTTASAPTNFFRFNQNTGRTFGLFVNPPPDSADWPNAGGFNAAINPINGNDLVLSSQIGNVFRTNNGGIRWFLIGNGASDLDGSNAQALAYGAPDPLDPSGNVDNFIYAGTVRGHVYISLDGGHWTQVSGGLDGSSVQQIVTNPARGSHEAYAVTSQGIYHLTFQVQLDRTLNRLVIVGTPTWQNVTGNVFQLTHKPFGISDLQETSLKNLTTIVADWRYAILDDPTNPSSTTHPVLYVGGDAGVYRSLDGGKTWTIFPDVAHDGAPINGGNLPFNEVTHLDLALGNVNPTTGLGSRGTSLDMLFASTYGRGTFAIRLNSIGPLQKVFALGIDNRVYGQRLDASGNPSSGYAQTSQDQVITLATGHDNVGQPILFAQGFDSQVYFQRFDINGNPTSDFALAATGAVRGLLSGNDSSGNPELFAIGLDNQVYYLNFDANDNPVGSYSIVDVGAVKSVQVGHDVQQHPELFVVGLDDQIYARRLDATGKPLTGETWQLIQPGKVKSFSVAQDSSGRPEILAVGLDSQVYGQKFNDSGSSVNSWFLAVPTVDGSSRQVFNVVAGHDTNNAPIVFATGLDGQVYQANLAPNGSPSATDYSITAPGTVKTFQVAYDANNLPEIFAIGLDNQIYLQQFGPPSNPIGMYRLMDAGTVKGLFVSR